MPFVSACAAWQHQRVLRLFVRAGLSDVLDTNARNLARGEKARAFIRKVWKKPTLLLLGAPVSPCEGCRGSHWSAIQQSG